MVLVSHVLSAQEKLVNKSEKDSVIHFFAWFELESGIHVLSDSDSSRFSNNIKSLTSELKAFEEVNKRKLFSESYSLFKEKASRKSLSRRKKVILFFNSYKSLLAERQRLMDQNGNNILNLTEFQYEKTSQLSLSNALKEKRF